MRKAAFATLIVTVLAAVGALSGTLAAGKKPQLGLDLQGGVSVVLAPDKKVDSGVLDTAINIIRSRVDAIGVAEPEISREGDNILVQLPGIKDQKRALDLVGTTAEVRFRPVIRALPVDVNVVTSTSSSASTTAASTTTQGSTTTTAVGATTTTTAVTDRSAVAKAEDCATTTLANIATSDPSADEPSKTVVLTEQDSKHRVVARYCLGPSELLGNAVSGASVVFNGAEPEVSVNFTDAGLNAFNKISQKCFNADASCPSKRVSIVLDSVVKSAPTIQPGNSSFQPFTNQGVTISGGGNTGMTRGEANDLALVLKYGSLPVKLTPQSVQTVSATLGKDSLRAGLIAGIVGLSLVILFMLAYYRILGLVVLGGLLISGVLLYSIVSLFGATLTLSGIAGIIVSIGVTVDSYVVYFEKLKDEVRAGKTVRSSAERSFKAAYRTILAADASSLIGAALLFWLTEGSVKGFAFFLGLSTLLDMITAYMFTRPTVMIVSRSKIFNKDHVLGIPVVGFRTAGGIK